MKKYIPNTVSVLRIIGAVALIAVPIFTRYFFAVYAVCAVFDFVDGFLAKTMNLKTVLGDRLDHIASILFIVVMSLRYFSVMDVPDWAVYTLMGLAFIKCASMVFGGVRFKKAPFIGSDWNKAAKVAFYLSPLWYMFAGMTFACVVVIAIMFVACVEELIINLTSKEYNPEVKTIIPFDRLVKKLKKKSK
ncbi:MAG: CDP-alcohol phosphatidyltransferase family protein [Clostridiales bacterium]|nr:CDP-alcohol phosphatidyltransferase family protein [Clostridiales bacterium]